MGITHMCRDQLVANNSITKISHKFILSKNKKNYITKYLRKKNENWYINRSNCCNCYINRSNCCNWS